MSPEQTAQYPPRRWMTPLDPCFWETEDHTTPRPQPHPLLHLLDCPSSLMCLDRRDISVLCETQHCWSEHWWHYWGPGLSLVLPLPSVLTVGRGMYAFGWSGCWLAWLMACVFGQGAVTVSWQLFLLDDLLRPSSIVSFFAVLHIGIHIFSASHDPLRNTVLSFSFPPPTSSVHSILLPFISQQKVMVSQLR